MDKYGRRGVSATKDEVHQAISKLDKGLYPNAFCKILPDIMLGKEPFCCLMHADTAGTKTALAYLWWRETGDLGVWRGIAQDAIVMNLDDMGCVGCTDRIVLSSTIGRNKNLIPGEVLSALIDGTTEVCDMLRSNGIGIHLAGGETADVGDIVRTVDVGYTAFSRMRRIGVLDMNIQPGDVVVGLASFGKAHYETAYNSGIGSNGLTSARHDVLSKHYATTYPECFDPNTPEDVVFCGSKRLTDRHGDFSVGELLLSPTRTFLPVMRAFFDHLRPHLHGIIHSTGGGQTKVKKFIHGCRVVKDNLFDPPPVFQMIQEESGTPNREMFQVFNMGCRLEVYVPQSAANQVIAIAKSFGIDAQIIGHVEASEKEEVLIKHGGEEFLF